MAKFDAGVCGMVTWARRTFLSMMGGVAVCAAGGSCACLIDPKTGKSTKGCPCRKSKECTSGRCSKRVCR
jgi:hypothetical protein